MGFWSRLFRKKERPPPYVEWREPKPEEIPAKFVSESTRAVVWGGNPRLYGEVLEHAPGVYKNVYYKLIYICEKDEFAWTVFSIPFKSYFDTVEKATEEIQEYIRY